LPAAAKGWRYRWIAEFQRNEMIDLESACGLWDGDPVGLEDLAFGGLRYVPAGTGAGYGRSPRTLIPLTAPGVQPLSGK